MSLGKGETMDSPEDNDAPLSETPGSDMGAQVSSGAEGYVDVPSDLEETEEWKLILPDLSTVVVRGGQVARDGITLAEFTLLERTESLAISAFGTQFEDSNPVPKNRVVEISHPKDSKNPEITKEVLWIIVYVLFSVMKDQETIPISLGKLENKEAAERYILCSGLGRRHLRPTSDLFLSRAAFWQGAGTSAHTLGWLREYGDVVANFPLGEE